MPGTYRATSIQDGFLFLEAEEGLEELPEMEGTDSPLLTDGNFERPRRAAVRVVILKGWLQGADVADYWTRLKAAHALFDPKLVGALAIPLGDGSTATIQARTVAMVPLAERIGRTREWRVVLQSVGSPYWTYS